jgi:hypothetical protein
MAHFCNACLDTNSKGIGRVDTLIDRYTIYLICIRWTGMCGLYWGRSTSRNGKEGGPALLLLNDGGTRPPTLE